MKLQYGDSAARLVSERIAQPVATLALLRGIPDKRRVAGMVALVLDSNTVWQFDADSTLTGDNVLVVAPTDALGGRWLRMPGGAMLALPIYATTPDATALLTVPTGCLIKLHEFGWRVDRVFTGASNACLAVSSSNHPGHTGVGNFAASMVATQLNNMTVGTGCDYQLGPVASGTFDSHATTRRWMKPGDTIRLDVVGANFGTGVGAVLVACEILKNAGN